jgi:uncharacterized integral membrane protein (TIGR00698 family)
MSFLKSNLYGISLTVSIAIVALILSPFLPVGAVVIAIIIGIIIGNTFKLNEKFEKGVKFSESNILALSIALMGVNLNFRILKDTGINTILLVVSAMVLTIFSAILISRLFKIDSKLGILLGIGSAVCGSSAIAATDKIIHANQKNVGLSIAIVNFLGTIGVFLIPLLAGLIIPLSDVNAGIFAGNTLQAVGQAVAAGFSISETSGNIATLVKMTRVLMLLPVTLIIAVIFARSGKEDIGNKRPRIPLFVIGFALFSVIPSLNIIPQEIIDIISDISKYLLIIAMSAIGLKIKTKSILKDGKTAIIVGSFIFLIQILFSWIMINILLAK